MFQKAKAPLLGFFISTIVYGCLRIVDTIVALNIASASSVISIVVSLLMMSIFSIGIGVYAIVCMCLNKKIEVLKGVSASLFIVYDLMALSAIFTMVLLIGTDYLAIAIIDLVIETIAIIATLVAYYFIYRKQYKVGIIINLVCVAVLAIDAIFGLIALFLIEANALGIIMFLAMLAYVGFGLASLIILLTNIVQGRVGLDSDDAITVDVSTKEEYQPAAKLKELKDLFDSGVITQEEYEEKRKKYIDKL